MLDQTTMRNPLVLFLFVLTGCTGIIKNEDAQIRVEEGADITQTENTEMSPTSSPFQTDTLPTPHLQSKAPVMETDDSPLLGYWVGNFEPDKEKNDPDGLYLDEGFWWDRSNKINISIDAIKDTLIKGHSVVAGNDRPFEGSIKTHTSPTWYEIKVREPGDNKYDGVFQFKITDNELELVGSWKAYKKIDIQHRKYRLKKKEFEYDPTIQLQQARPYVNWIKKPKQQWSEEMDEWINKEFASATDRIYTINASEKLLSEKDVENLSRGDLTIIRNAIYARHGYSYKHRPLRLFFDAQPWYIPVHADIRSMFTDIEKTNIELLLRYEKNAAEYYDSFGRG